MNTIPRVELAPGYTISRVLKGGWQLAGGHGPVEEAAALDDMDRFVEAGVTTFDCADIYTGVEALIGRWRKRRRGRAGADAQVHTKYVPDLDRLPAHSRADVVRGVDRSLARLGVERLDLVQLHWWDYSVPGYVEAAVWLDELRRAGKIRHVGLTNFDRHRLSEIVASGATIASHQVQYSVLDRRPAAGLAGQCAETASDCSAGAVAGGFLSDRYLE
jgi:aryl-alcohol dehydrogenase-like predicted oxidoreductase